jgi:NAD(P)H-quinone oxidoreductase subunit 5
MLFLCSGSVIHAMEEVVGHEPVLAQDMRLMGGLRKYMPITSTTFFIGCLAISGIPPLAGFWSKDEILGQAFGSFPLLWAAGFITAGMTAFYMFRLYFLTFEGSFRGTDKTVQAQLMAAAGKDATEDHGDDHGHSHADHPHESAWQMAMPLAVLAVPSMLIGLLGTPWNSRFARLLNPEEAAHMAQHFSWGEFLPLAGASVAVSVVGISVSVLAYALHKIDLGTAVAARFPAVNAFLANKWYLDAINDKLFVQGSRKLARQVLEVDSKVVDGVVNLTGLVTLGSGEGLKYLETGRAQFYALIVFGGVIALVVLFGALG